MKCNTLFSLALTASLACLPLAAHAETLDQKKNNNQQRSAPQSFHPQQQQIRTQQQFHPQQQQFHTQQFHTQSTGSVHQFNRVNTNRNVTQTTRFRTNNVTQKNVTVYSHAHTIHNGSPGQFTPHGNRGNHYGGRWVDAGVHSGWGNSGDHFWHHHHYRWYNGGWLMVDPGFGPGGGSIPSAVQQSLSQQGYYNGPIDGDIGPGSQNAISNYQGDHGLNPSGQIDDPLLQSLGLE